MVSDKRLDSPSIHISTTSAQLTFRHRVYLQGGDGGVLEISINGGAFQDIITAGGGFVTGGYNYMNQSSFNPLAFRQVWTGANIGSDTSFATVIVNLPAAAAGQNIQLRWRLGTDYQTGWQGWRIDSISITECGSQPPTSTPTPVPPTSTPTRTPTPTPTPVTTTTNTPAPPTNTPTQALTPTPTRTPKGHKH